MESIEYIEQIVKRIIDAVTEPLEIDSHEIHLKCCIGISIFPGNGLNADSLLDNAGSALYNAKRNGNNTYQFHDDEISNTSLDSLKLENDLRHAIERNELELYYQPKVEVFSRKIVGMEALLRWNHPRIGLISPAEFIPLAEESGLIIHIGEWVLNTACRKIKDWESAGYSDISIAVNLSAVQFRQKDILDMIRNIVSDSAIDPKLLELEITESTIMGDIDSASQIMHALHREGLHISIDDFGTGYSSLTHLKRFPLNTVKIDRSFVRDLTTDLDDAAIIGAIIAMAHSMGLKIIAEGVETVEQLEYLQRLRCDEIQGFLFSKPLPADEAEDLLRRDVNGSAFADMQFSAVS
jgi:EAL domain-containing protein (putative c-di-GMP-specific phosphodiesterase class I)